MNASEVKAGFWAFLGAVVKDTLGQLSAMLGVALTAIGLLLEPSGQRWAFLIGGVVGLVLAPYRAWARSQATIKDLQAKLATGPLLSLSCDPEKEGCIEESKGEIQVRIRLRNDGNGRAHRISLVLDGGSTSWIQEEATSALPCVDDGGPDLALAGNDDLFFELITLKREQPSSRSWRRLFLYRPIPITIGGYSREERPFVDAGDDAFSFRVALHYAEGPVQRAKVSISLPKEGHPRVEMTRD